MDLILSFDTEDFVTPQAADAQKWWADELHSRNLRGCFQLVAEMLRTLKHRDRQDVIEALNRHEVDYHTNYHSLPPTHAHALEGKPLTEAIDWVLRHEATGLATHLETFGRMPVSYCQPGFSWTPATLIALASVGIKVFCGCPEQLVANGPIWYCGMLCVRYDLAFEAYFSSDDARIEAFKTDFDRIARAVGDDGLMIVFTHPTRLVTSAFWDEQFYGAVDVPPGQRRPAPLWPDDQIQVHKDYVRCCLDWLQSRDDVHFTDYAGAYMKRAANRRDVHALLAECNLVPGQEGQLPLRQDDDQTYLPAQTFDDIAYAWPPLPEGFTGQQLLNQARQLAWTSAPAGTAAPTAL